MTLRRRCKWLHRGIPLDGLGPFRPGDTYTDGMCPTCQELGELGLYVQRGLPWLRRTLLRIAQLEGDGRGHFGGTSVLAHWLCQRCRPAEPLRKAEIAQARRIAGSQANFRLILRMMRPNVPKRLQQGWTAMDVTTYLAQLWSERKAERA